MTYELLILCLAAFAAGFIDAIVGGGGLISVPAALIFMPGYPVATCVGTIKIPAFCGTSLAAWKYSRHVKLNYKHLAIMGILAMPMAVLGSSALTQVSNDFMKPVLLVVLSGVAFYTYKKKHFGVHSEKDHSETEHIIYAIIISIVIGLYDGFIGPGAGSFLILAFITLLGYDFMKAGATAKFVNLSTNIGSIILFASTGNIVYEIALPMAVCNATGAYFGARLAILRGNTFIRIFFLTVVIAVMIRFAWDVFGK